MRFRDYINEGLQGVYGKAGWLSKQKVEDFWPEGPDTDMTYLMMDINQELLQQKRGFAEKANLTDIRVDVSIDKQGKLRVQYPIGVHKDKKLLALYKKIVSKHIKAI